MCSYVIVFFTLQGTFVLQDNQFRWLTHTSIDASTDNVDASQQDSSSPTPNNAAQLTSMHLYFPCGIIRGALTNLGIPCAVSADISNLPACELQGLNPKHGLLTSLTTNADRTLSFLIFENFHLKRQSQQTCQ